MDGLIVNDLSISFGGVHALKRVSFEVKPGEILGLIGPNGAGKTSLINCVSRYYKPTTGQITFNGMDLLKKKSHQLIRLGVARTFQELDVQPTLSVMDNLLVGQHSVIQTNLLRSILDFSYMKSEERQYRRKARDIMRFFSRVRKKSERSQEELGFPDISGRGGYPDLLDVQDVPVGSLPYGIRKKVDFARALVARPKLLLLDEPASGLGMGDLDEMKNLIKAAQAEFGLSVLLVEHQMPLVMKLCDRIVVLDFGEKIAEGTPAEIRGNPAVIKAYLGTQRPNEAKTGKTAAAEVRASTKGAAAVPATENLLELKEVDLSYGPVKALSGVSLRFGKGGITAILGSNGAGKSTLMKAISGIERISSGEILFEGSRLTHWLQEPRPDKIVRRGIIHVAEGRRIFKELSVMENLRVSGYTLGDRKRLARNIEKVFYYFPKLKEKLRLKDAGNLSGGQQQMLAIGQALIMEPKLLLLDEPSLGLSPTLVEEVFEIVKKINEQEACSIVIVEQNTDMALRYSSFAYVLETGFVMKHGPSEELRVDPELKKIYLGD